MNKYITGIQLSTAATNIRYTERDDVALIACDANATLAGVFTKNAFQAAPVIIAKQHLAQRDPRKQCFLIINAGNANAATGNAGLKATRTICAAVAQATNVPVANVLPFSTGVIGELLPTAPIVKQLPSLIASLRQDAWQQAASAIMTTDAYPKYVAQCIDWQGETINIVGIAKGAGMIQPNMATMLAYIATDTCMDTTTCQTLLTKAVDRSFNCISVDGDSSTNDACILIATNATKAHIKATDPAANTFVAALQQVMLALATAIVKDGEGATRLMCVEVTGARDATQARTVAFKIVNSPLVKTALFAADPNWGRLIAAIGNGLQGEADLSTIAIYLNDYQVVANGARATEYTEKRAQVAMAQPTVTIRVALGFANAAFTAYGCDLSHQYIDINAHYRS